MGIQVEIECTVPVFGSSGYKQGEVDSVTGLLLVSATVTLLGGNLCNGSLGW